jgi:hypothetical protein
MNSTTIANMLMSGTALLVAGGGGIRYLLQRKTLRRKDAREDQASATNIKLTDTQRQQVSDEAEKVYSSNRIEIEKWWLEQFQLVQKQLTDERNEQNERWAKLRKAARVHKVWDDEQVRDAHKEGRHPRPAPSLDPDDYQLDDAEQEACDGN